MRDKKLPDAERDLEKIESELSELRTQNVSTAIARQAFTNHFRYFLEEVKLIHNFSSITWSNNTNLPLIDNQGHTKAASGPDLALIILAFHYALLAMSVSEPSIRTNHPKILLVDEHEQQKMGAEKGKAVLRLLADLANKYKDKLQIIITASEEDISEELQEYEIRL